MNFCVNCKHMVKSSTDETMFAKCARTKTNDPVSGDPHFTFCSTERTEWSASVHCGPDGKYFEAKEADNLIVA